MRRKCTYKDNITVDLEQIVCEVVDWNQVTVRMSVAALVNMTMYLRVP